ncbi:hypothetical protein JKF63_07984 [Porcisia hertigi]|uniref:Phosphodiesterase n=1 Tax=Porcisia hertigi TaxID=2761500 RepID=A0A836IJZ9_9TRYP|nr:hypothetical protein JKF63_07984 [Porcisia hertigi]
MSLMPGYPVPTTQWVKSAEECAACGKRFSFFNSKDNCPCCGQLFCTKCLPGQCILAPMAKPTPVCLGCTQKIQNWLSSQHQRQGNSDQVDASAETVPLSTSMAALEAKLNALEGELHSTKSGACQLREENDRLVDLLAVKDARIAELKAELTRSDASPGAATESAEKLRVQVQEAMMECTAMKRRLKEAEERAEGAAQTNEVMVAQVQGYAKAKADWELLAEKLRSAVRQAEDLSAQSSEEVNKLRASMQAMKAHSERKIKELTDQLQSVTNANTQLQKDYDRNAEALHAAERCRISSDAQHSKELQLLREQLEKAATALAQKDERYEYHLGSTKRPAEDTATGSTTEVERELDTLNKRLAASNRDTQHFPEKISRAVEGDLHFQRNSVRRPQTAPPFTSGSLTKWELQERAVGHGEASAGRRAGLVGKERLVVKLQCRCREAAIVLRAKLDSLRAHLSETKMAYEEGQLAFQASLSTLRDAVEAAEDQRASEVAAVASASGTVPGRDAADATKSRWGQPTIIEDLRFPCVDGVDVHAIEAVSGLANWEFDTVAEAQRGGEADVLVRIGHQIALDLFLFPDEASLHRWACLLVTVQANYRANPYHNRVHAADVMQGVYALMCNCPSLLGHMTTVEKRAVVFAAAVHDLRHPGRSEAFLRNTFDATYLHYNGLQVLEQMHTATAFQLLARPELDFTSGDMSDEEALQFHGLVAALIGCTFMGRHASLMEQWSRPLQHGKTYDLAAAADRQQVLSIFLHAADLGAQSRGLVVSQKWVGVVEEMCAQGDEEAARGLPLSPGGSRSASFERGQLFFLETFVFPLFDLVHQLFPVIDSPMRNLRAVHAHYCAALRETTRAFPAPIQYRNATEPTSNEVVEPCVEALGVREAALEEQKRAVDQAIYRLRKATTAVTAREKRLGERETAEERVGTYSGSGRDEGEVTPLSTVEEELLRAATAVLECESEVGRRAAEVERMMAALEGREAIASGFSAQLAAIADRVNRRRQLVSCRERRVEHREEALRRERATDLCSSGSVTELTGCAAAERVTNIPPPDCVSPSCVTRVKLESALEKLNSALQNT